MKALKPKNYVKSTEKNQQYECSICNYIAEKPYTCNGPCKQIYCFQCMNCIKRNANVCPFRCSQTFQLTECKEVQIQFRCPFNPEKCCESIPTLARFYAHGDYCKFTPYDWKQREEYYERYRCRKGHQLFFMDQADIFKVYGVNSFEIPINSICSSCGQKGLCRTICPKCSDKKQFELYCTNCRKPPCTKKTCLYSHKLLSQPILGPEVTCDFCGTGAHLLGPRVYSDRECNFDICTSCYTNLPQTHELVPFKMEKSVLDHLVEQKVAQPSYFLGQHVYYPEVVNPFNFPPPVQVEHEEPPYSEESEPEHQQEEPEQEEYDHNEQEQDDHEEQIFEGEPEQEEEYDHNEQQQINHEEQMFGNEDFAEEEPQDYNNHQEQFYNGEYEEDLDYEFMLDYEGDQFDDPYDGGYES